MRVADDAFYNEPIPLFGPVSPRLIPVVHISEVVPKLDAADFVEGLLIDGSMAVVYGRSNSGKTFWCSDLALHVACGKQWQDREVDQRAVLWIAMEGSHGIYNRVAAWLRKHPDTPPLHFIIIPTALNLLDPDADTQPLIDTIKAQAESLGIAIGLVVVDTLSRAIAGGNENSPEDMGALVRNGDLIRQATQACVMWIHHCGKDEAKGARGHSLLLAATDTEIEISEAEDGDRIVTVRKQRELPREGSFAFTLEVVELGLNRRGKPVTSCVVVHSGQTAGAVPDRRTPLSGHPKRALEVLITILAEAGKWHPGTPDGVPSIPEKWWRERFYESAMPGGTPDAKKHAFSRASDKLIEYGRVGMGLGRVWAVQKRGQFDGS